MSPSIGPYTEGHNTRHQLSRDWVLQDIRKQIAATKYLSDLLLVVLRILFAFDDSWDRIRMEGEYQIDTPPSRFWHSALRERFLTEACSHFTNEFNILELCRHHVIIPCLLDLSEADLLLLMSRDIYVYGVTTKMIAVDGLKAVAPAWFALHDMGHANAQLVMPYVVGVQGGSMVPAETDVSGVKDLQQSLTEGEKHATECIPRFNLPCMWMWNHFTMCNFVMRYKQDGEWKRWRSALWKTDFSSGVPAQVIVDSRVGTAERWGNFWINRTRSEESLRFAIHLS